MKKINEISFINDIIIAKFCIEVVHDKPIPHSKQNEDSDVLDDEVILLKFECFRQNGLNFKRLYISSLWIKYGKNS